MNHEAFDKMMGYAMHTVTELVEKAKEINRNSIIALNNRDLTDNGIENDQYSTSSNYVCLHNQERAKGNKRIKRKDQAL